MLQSHEKHFLFTFENETLHRNIDRVAAVVETHQAFLLSCGDRFLLEITPRFLLVQSYPGAADGKIRLSSLSQKIMQKMLRLVALGGRMVRMNRQCVSASRERQLQQYKCKYCPTV